MGCSAIGNKNNNCLANIEDRRAYSTHSIDYKWAGIQNVRRKLPEKRPFGKPGLRWKI
jgi:hypothetical protein